MYSGKNYFGWLILLLVFLLFWRLGATPIYILDEAKNAQCAREMMQRADWVVPVFNGELRTDKPVLHYYFMAGAYKVFGVSEFAARFFSAIAGFLTVVLTFLFVKRFSNGLTAFFSSLSLVASVHFIFEFRLSVPDPYLIFFLTAGLFSFFIYIEEKKLSFLFYGMVAFALATLTKGPVAILLPGLCLLVWAGIRKKWQSVFNWWLLLAVILFVIIALPWYMAVDKATGGEWTKGFFFGHNLNRFSQPQEGHGGLFILPLVFVVIGLLPFTSFAGELFKNRKQLFREPLVQFSGIVVLAFVLFFSLSATKLPQYPMPCYPFAAVILGHYLYGLSTGSFIFKKYPVYIILFFLVAIPVAAWFSFKSEAEIKGLSSYVLLLSIPALLTLLLLFRWKQIIPSTRIAAIASLFAVLSFLGLHYLYPAIYRQNPVVKTIDLVKKYPAVFAYKKYNPGYNFYLNSIVQQYDDFEKLKEAIQKEPEAVIISRKNNSDDLAALGLYQIASHKDIFELPTTVIYVTRQ